MPSVSDKQKKFMAAATHSKTFAKKADIPQSVAKEFNKADSKGKPSNEARSSITVGNFKDQ